LEQTYALRASPVAPLLSAVTEGELRSLALMFRWGPAKVQEMHDLLGSFVTVQLDLAGIYDAYAEIREFSQGFGITIGENDAWIAATARVTGARLLTTDADFDHLHPAYLNRDYIDPQNYR